MDIEQIIKGLLGNLQECIPAIFASLFGGFVRALNSKECPRTRVIGVYVVTGWFVGLITYWIMKEFKVNMNIIAATCGVCGYSANSILEIVSKRLLDRISKIDITRGSDAD